MMGFYDTGTAFSALYHIGIKGPLEQEIKMPQVPSFFFKHLNEQISYDFSLLLRVDNAF